MKTTCSPSLYRSTPKIIVLLTLLFFGCQNQNLSTVLSSTGYFIGADSLKLFYQFEGTGSDTVVMIHGGPGMDAGYLINDFKPLAKNHVLLYYDQRGSGRSALPDTTLAASALHIDRHIADVEALRNYFHLSKVNLLGHSFGTVIAGMYALAYPEKINSLLLIGAVPPYAGDFGGRYEKSLNSRLSTLELKMLDSLNIEIASGHNPVAACIAYWQIAMKPRIASGLDIKILQGDCCRAPAEAIQYGYRYTNPITFSSLGDWDFREGLRKVTAPTLLIHGTEESIPMDMVEEWTKFLPNSSLIKVERAAHFPYVEQPEKVWPPIETFLQSIKEPHQQ